MQLATLVAEVAVKQQVVETAVVQQVPTPQAEEELREGQLEHQQVHQVVAELQAEPLDA